MSIFDQAAKKESAMASSSLTSEGGAAVARVCTLPEKMGAIAFFLSFSFRLHPPLHFSGRFDFRRSTSASQLISSVEREKFCVSSRDERSPTRYAWTGQACGAIWQAICSLQSHLTPLTLCWICYFASFWKRPHLSSVALGTKRNVGWFTRRWDELWPT